MSRPPDYKYTLSERLSEVMDDIGVNDRLVNKTREVFRMTERSDTLEMIIMHNNKRSFCFGSRSEGSTTLGLESDYDGLYADYDLNVIQSMSERKHGVNNLMMIQDENISPGYCYLQYAKPVLMPSTRLDIYCMNNSVTDGTGKRLVKNSTIKSYCGLMTYTTQCGPAFSEPQEQNGTCAQDTVVCLYCESAPLQASAWLQKQTEYTWPSEDVMKSCRNGGCFVVPVGSKVSKRPELEWRVSTCLQERYLMFSLNITQLRCYILMKMILKTYINPHIEDVLSSYMCKNVLFYCVADSSHEWHTGTLLAGLLNCLLKLKECVVRRNCPHFIIPENNLLAGKMTDTERDCLLFIINILLTNDEQLPFGIQIDDVGCRLKIKLNKMLRSSDIPSSAQNSRRILSWLMYDIAQFQSTCLNTALFQVSSFNLEVALQYLSERLPFLNGFIIPLVSSTLGSVLACLDTRAYAAISANAFSYLVSGLESDALSGRLKLASVLYCTGDVKRAEKVLFDFVLDSDFVQPVCTCFNKGKSYPHCEDPNEEAVSYLVAFCTRFLQCEINCIPHELRYELWRSYTGDGRRIREVNDDDKWMELIVVDSLPYIYFLQYKVYGRLQRRRKKQLALNELKKSIDIKFLERRHVETSLNLLGQCFEQENIQNGALGCYISSLKYRPSNNAAGLLMCIQLLRILKKCRLL